MNSQRHPHPHVDPRQPRGGSRPGTNPPVFAWKPPKDAKSFSLIVARDESLRDVVISVDNLADPVFLPEKALAPGRYWWRWSAPGAEGEVLHFDILPGAAVVEVPSVEEWLKRFPSAHPRIWVRPEQVSALRESRNSSRAGLWRDLSAAADKLLAESHELAEPPFLPPWDENFAKTYKLWWKITFDSRGFLCGAETLALAWMAGGREDCARAACRRLASISRWNPDGSTHLEHNDEPHMSVIWWGPTACDWVWDHLTPEERRQVVAHFRRRGQITFEEMHDNGCYGVERFDSHAGREIVFLAQIALVFHEEIPEAKRWLEWLRPVLCGVWPIWAGDDGAWAEGPSYGLAYVTIMARFASALKRGAGIDLYRRPFWAGHAKWRAESLPAYAEWMGFGDHTEHWSGNWMAIADLVELIDRETGANAWGKYVSECRRFADMLPTPPERKPDFSGFCGTLAYLTDADTSGKAPAESGSGGNVLSVFPDGGAAAFRTAPYEPARDVALIFRSSPYGSMSHSHANNNDFILHAGGKVLAQPSGYYDGYGSDHHRHWNWHTKSHNCLTLSGSSQPVQSPDARGAVLNPYEDARVAYLTGDASASYALLAERCRRHVVFLKPHNCFLMVDEYVGRPGLRSACEWNIHSWASFTVDEASRRFRLEREGCALTGHFLYHLNSFFTVSQGWDPPPKGENLQWHMQNHLRFTTSGFDSRRNLGVLLCPSAPGIKAPAVETAKEGKTEVARIGGDTVVRVRLGEQLSHLGKTSDGVAIVACGDAAYEIGEWGIRAL